MKFHEFDLNNNVTEAINDLGYSEATPIQEKAIPFLLQEKDLVGCAQTGTGKTAAFAIPIINYIHRIVGSGKKRKQIRTVILSPTRELAIQLAEHFEALRSEEHTSELQSRPHLVCRLLLEKKKKK